MAGKTFNYFLSNPPFGVDWKKQQKEIEHEHGKRGFAGRFGTGLPRVNDGALLFLQHMIAPPRPLEEIDAELKQVEDEILRLWREVVG